MQGQGEQGAGASARFYALLALVVVGLSAGYAALVLYSAPWPAAAALRDFYIWQPRAYTAGEFELLRRALAGLAVGALGLASGLALTAPATTKWQRSQHILLASGLALTAPGRAELAGLGQELKSAWAGLAAGWRALRPGQRRGAWGLLLALTALRGYYSLVIAPGDDGVSYEVFVRARLLLLSAAYPMPNNHVLSNTLDWLFYQVHPGFWWSMRLPVVLTSTGATVLWFVALLRRSSFRVALLAVSLFSVLQVSFYHAVTGRGYWLLVGLGAVGFFAMLELSAASQSLVPGPAAASDPADGGLALRPARVRAAWAGLVLSGVLGLYTVPTHAYFLASVYGWLGLGLVRRRAWAGLPRLAVLGGLTLLGAGLLYAPLWLISGPRLMFHNDYVLPLAPGAFWRGLPAYVWLTEGWLSGHRWLGVAPLLAVLAGTAALWRRARAGGLPAGLASPVRQLVPPALALLAAPYLLLLGQRVQAPERTLFYKSMLLCVLAALLAEWGWQWLAVRSPAGAGRRRAGRRYWGLLAAAGLAFGAGQVFLVARYNTAQVWLWQTYRRPMAWLATQPVGPVLAPEPVHRLILRFYAHTEFGGQPWQIDDRPRPGVHYRYLVSKPGAHYVPGGPPVAGTPAFHGLADIFVAP